MGRASAGVLKGKENRPMDIVRTADGTLTVPVDAKRQHHEDGDETSSAGTDAEPVGNGDAPTTRQIHPGEGGYDEALAEWDHQQNPDRAPVVSTATGRQEAMTLVHAVAVSPDHAVDRAVKALDDPEASGEALRHVLVGGVHSVEDFATQVARAEGGEPLSAHETTKIIGEVLTELDE
ncbi:MAG TPA: hypothetical protein VNC61_16485 [Acidimicrobiales bacterium]|nr:hypothetical protein [Acidimicrobiales bacterium]